MGQMGGPKFGILKAQCAEDGVVEAVEIDTEVGGFLLFMDEAGDGADGGDV